MDQELRAELTEILRNAEVRFTADMVKIEADLLVLSEMLDKKALRSDVIARTIGHGQHTAAAVTMAAILSTRATARALAERPDFQFGEFIEGHECEVQAHAIAHDYAVELLDSGSQSEAVDIARRIEATLEGMTTAERAHFMVNIAGIGASLLLNLMDIQEEKILEVVQEFERDEGDSRS